MRGFSILLSESAGLKTTELLRLLPDLRCTAQVKTVRELDPIRPDPLPDAVIASCGEAELASSYISGGHCAVLLLGDAAAAAELLPWAVSNGILCADRSSAKSAVAMLLAVCTRLQSMGLRENNLQRKLTDIKLVNRAKLLLMTRLQMTEAEAHRYLEKTAMDNGENRRDVALRVIHTYEE